MSEIKTSHLLIKGKVQGVWYRGWAVENARELSLSGWVRNRHDRRVEILIKGHSQDVDEMTRRCLEGPSLARVDAIEVAKNVGYVPPIEDGVFRKEVTY